jgi:hypothetical protein
VLLTTLLVGITVAAQPKQQAANDISSARIKAGTIQLLGPPESVLGTMAISGNNGFMFSPSFEAGTEAMCNPCEPGDTISLSADVGQFNGIATYRGQIYEFNFTNGSGRIFLQGPSFTLPPVTGTEPTTVEFETPFTVLDQSRLMLQSGENGEIQNYVRLTGSGTATARLQVYYDPSFGHFYYFESLRFEFSKHRKSATP